MTQLLNDFLSGSAAWGVLLTLAAFALGALINKLTGKAIFNPLLLGSIFVIVFLSVCKIPYADYKISAAPVNYLLLPATVALAIPLYEKIDLLKENAAQLCGHIHADGGGHGLGQQGGILLPGQVQRQCQRQRAAKAHQRAH